MSQLEEWFAAGAARRLEPTGCGSLDVRGYLTVPPEALIAYHVPPNALTPT
jgi:hypothetical protein